MSTSTINTTIPSTSSDVTFLPADAWFSIPAPGATNGQAKFDRGDNAHGLGDSYITYTFSQPATGFEYWGYQRSDGGLFNICFDCPPSSTLGDRIDALNKSTNGSEPPRLLYSKYDLSYAVHNLTITNLLDSRATIGNATNGAYGQINMDRFVLISPPAAPSSTTSSDGSPSTSPISSATAAPSGSKSPSSNHAGAIAGGVVGGLVGLAILAALLIFLLRRRKRQSQISPYPTKYRSVPQSNAGAFALEPAPPGNGRAVSPWSSTWTSEAPATVATSPGAPFSTDTDRSLSPPGTISTMALTGARQPKGIASQRPRHVQRPSNATTSPSVYPATSESSWPTSDSDTVRPRREQDAGFLQGDEDDEPALPPDYDVVTGRRR